MRVTLLAGIGLSQAFVSLSHAGDSPATGLEPVVVTATRSEQALNRVGDSITVLDAAQIRYQQKTAVSDLLATTPGVTISRNGGLGATTSLRIRGAEGDHTVVLIDGVKLNDPSAPGGGYNFANLLTDDSSRIEVLRGPQSTLWGSQALGGVVNVVTPLPEGPLTTSVSAEGGSRETGRLRAKVESGGDRLAWRLSGTYFTTAGISAFDENLGGTEDDSYRNVNFSGRMLARINEYLAADLRSTYWYGRNEFDGFPAPAFELADTREYGESRELVAYAGFNIDTPSDRWTHRMGYAFTDTDRQNIDPDASVRTTFDAFGRNGRWEYQGTFKITDGYETVFGLESEKSELSTASPNEFDPNPVPLARDVRLDSAYANLQAAPLEAVTLSAGLRHDDHEAFGETTTGRAAVAWSMLSNTVVRASYGEGFKAPTLFHLFSEFGNAALRPEEAEGWDAGVEHRAFDGVLMVSATWFERDTSNQIDFVSCFSNPDPRCVNQPFGFYDNVQQTTASGLELAAELKVDERLAISANFTRTDAENAVRGGVNEGRNLPRQARNVANADVRYLWPSGLLTSFAVHRVGKSFDDAANQFLLDGYTLVDLRASQVLSERLEVYGRIENLLDEEYQTLRQYGSEGRGVFVGFRTSL